MKLSEGRIGNAEGIGFLGIALTVNGLFVLDIAEDYRLGNTAYLAFPAAILLGLAVFLLLWGAMRLSGKQSLPALLDHALGKTAGSLMLALLIGLLLFDAYCLLSRFVTMVHTLVYGNDTVFTILVWITGTAACIAFLGFECIGRLAKCFAPVLLLLLLCELAIPIESYEAYRLFPLPEDAFSHAAADAVRGSFAALPPLVLLLCFGNGLQGLASIRRIGVIAALSTAALTCAAQLCIGMVFGADELQKTFIPLYELNTKMVAESYFFRLDKVALFLWLIGAVITAAYETYGAANLFCRRFSRHDVRPPVIAFFALLLCSIAAEHAGCYALLTDMFDFVHRFGAAVLLSVLASAAAVSLLKSAWKRRKLHEAQ